MGVRGLIRDFLGLYIGFRLLISPLMPMPGNELVIFGLLVFGFSFWFTMERVGVLK